MIPALARCAGGEDAARSASDHLKGSKAKKEHVGLRKAAPALWTRLAAANILTRSTPKTPLEGTGVHILSSVACRLQ